MPFLNRLQIGQQALTGTPSFRLIALQPGPLPKLTEHFAFHGEIGLEITTRRGHRAVAQIVTDGGQVNACLEQRNRTAMTPMPLAA